MSHLQRIFRHWPALLAAGLILAAAPAQALELHEAKARGLVGETPTGYLGIVAPNAGAEVKALVARINAARRERYQEIARRNGTDLATVEALAGKKAIEATPSGQYVQDAGGRWIKKP